MIPQTISDSIFGDLLYEEALPGYTGSVLFYDNEIKINFVTQKQEEVANLTEKAMAFFEEERFLNCFMAGIKALTALKNSDWLEEKEQAYEEEELYDEVSLDAFVFHTNGIDCYSEDLDIFWKQRIILKFDNAFTLIEAKIDEPN